MMEIKNIDSAIAAFEDAASKHAEATEQGDFKKGNKCYKSIADAVGYLKDHDALFRLEALLKHTSVGVRMWAATFLLPISEMKGTKALKEISEITGIHSMTAKTTLSEWQKGNLKL